MIRNPTARLALVGAVLAAAPVLAETPTTGLASAPAKTGVPEAAFSNTVVSTYPDGRTAKLWLERNGTYRGQGRRGKPSSGKWTIKGEQICLRQSRPFPAPFNYCTAVKQGEVGSEWAGKAVTGEAVKIKLVSGR